MTKRTVNLLKVGVPVDELTNVLSQNRGKSFCPAAGTVWREAAARPCARTAVQLWRMQRKPSVPWKDIPEDLYADFFRTGDRSRWETWHAHRRERLGRAALCVAIQPDDSEGMQEVLEGWQSTLEEPSWANPAHVSAPSGIDPLNVDLKCAETALMLAWIARMFGRRAPARLTAATRERLRAQVWENHLTATARTDGAAKPFEWTRKKSNWNAVCHCGVLASALLLCEDDTLTARLLARTAENLVHYLDGFGNDGGCSEGPSYWSYGFGFFSLLNRELEARTDGALSFFEGDEKLRAIARYPLFVAVENLQAINHADAADRTIPPDLLNYLGRRLADQDLLRLAQATYAVCGTRDARDLPLKPGFFSDALYLLDGPTGTEPIPPEGFPGISGLLPDLQLWVSRGTDTRGRRWVVGAKGGHNGEQHNHNDVGSFVLFLDGVPMISEIGMPAYHRDYFQSESRYRFLAARSFGHSVPLVGGMEQAAGKEFRGRLRESFFSERTDRFVLDLTKAYPPSSHCLSALRTIEVDKATFRLRVRDVIETSDAGTVESAVITSGAVSRENGGVRISRDGTALLIRPEPGSRLRTVEELEYRDHSHHPAFVRRIVFEPETRRHLAEIGFTARAV
jgi:Heparinase II/III-like protein.